MYNKITLAVILILGFMLVMTCCAGGDNTDNNGSDISNGDNSDNVDDVDLAELGIKNNEEAKSAYQTAYEKWTVKNKSKTYYLKVSYQAFSPIAGIWELEVEDGKVIEAVFNGENLSEDDNIRKSSEQFKMEHLFEVAKRSYQKTDTSLFFVIVKYDRELGYVKQISKVVNPDIPNEQIPTDQTYRYEVLEYKQK